MPLAYILLGSNLGNSKNYLEQANNLIAMQCGKIIKSSSIYETQPWGITNQPNYLNQVIVCNTELTPFVLLQKLLSIEKKLGRIRTTKNASRYIDLDILFYGKQMITAQNLQIPHPKIQERNFTLIPLNEISPKKIHPKLKKSIKNLLATSTDTLSVIKILN